MTTSAWLRPVAAALLLATLATPACRRNRPDDGKDKDKDGTPTGTIVYNGSMTEAERHRWYHVSEGSEIIPVHFLLALNDPRTGRPFLDDPERLGLLPDRETPRALNYYGLPIGLSADTSVDTRWLGMTLLGFNCAACHTTELRYQGNRLRVDGSQSLFGPVFFVQSMLEGIGRLLTHPAELFGFVKRLKRIEREFPGVHAQRTREGPPGAQVPPGDSAILESLTDADTTVSDSVIMAEVVRALREDSVRVRAVSLDSVVVLDSVTARDRALGRRYSDAAADSFATRVLNRVPDQHEAAVVEGEPATRGGPPAAAADRESLRSVIGDIGMVARILRDRLEAARSLTPLRGQTQPGYGRADAFGVARNRIYPRDTVNQNAPVSYPHLWDLDSTAWMHYDANTNSLMERNLGQALGVGAGMDPVTFRSTLNVVHIYELELLARKTRAPEWPAFFPPVDSAKAQRGRTLYGTYCAGCHLDTPNDLCFRGDSVRTDTMRLRNFSKPMRDGRTFTVTVGPVLTRLKTVGFDVFNVPPAQRLRMDGGLQQDQIIWRTTRMWGARPLDGIWGSPPFLHNGSVPTLWDLLLPANRRPRTFPLGHHDFDPQKLGFRTDTTGRWTFDTRQQGNGNGGHEYGTREMSDAQRWDLVEYLKVHRGWSGPVQTPSWVTRCPQGPS
ncbi:MAG TPA: hypothetical protein VFX98_16470 [Longimicrobiaceae bacterium]|nr:hypothetical protein [Longimicrobiaceae bacterium]